MYQATGVVYLTSSSTLSVSLSPARSLFRSLLFPSLCPLHHHSYPSVCEAGRVAFDRSGVHH